VTEQAERRTEQALQRADLADFRPLYRKLLVRLKSSDPEAFREATRRYQEDLEPSIADGTADPLAAWLGYGRWLAGRFADGHAVTIDRSGRARPLDEAVQPDDGSLVIHLPADARAAALLLAEPRKPSEPQRMTIELLVR